MTTTPSIALIVLIAVLVGTGIYLLLERSLTRVIVGIALMTNGINVMFLVASGSAGRPPLLGQEEDSTPMADPLPQAMVLTAIVISMGVTAFLLSLAYRSWQLNGHDEVQDDLEDRRIARRAMRYELPERSTEAVGTEGEEESEAAEVRDETATADISPVRGPSATGEGQQ